MLLEANLFNIPFNWGSMEITLLIFFLAFAALGFFIIFRQVRLVKGKEFSMVVLHVSSAMHQKMHQSLQIVRLKPSRQLSQYRDFEIS